jgi:hypothetical protein
MQRSDQASIIRMITDRQDLDLEVLGLQEDFCAGDGKFAEPAVTEAAADDDPLRLLPGLRLEKTTRYVGELLRELFDRAVNDCRRLGVVAHQDAVQYLLADVLRRLLAKWVLAGLSQRLAPSLENFAVGALAGAAADESSSSFSSMLKLSISTDGRREAPWGAIPVVVMTSSANSVPTRPCGRAC